MPEEPIDWSKCDDVESVPGRVSGAWVIKDTRVPAQTPSSRTPGPDAPPSKSQAPRYSRASRWSGVRGVLQFAKITPTLEWMRILLDQNTPIGVRRILAAMTLRTAPEMGWATLSNSDLLDAADNAGFEAFVTCDQNLLFQQNVTGRNIAVVILSTNFWPTIRAQPQRVRRAVANASPGTFTRAVFGPPRRSRRPPTPTC